jgi:amidophosphoribosyltransferase
MGYEGRDDANPQFTDHCFTGDYPTPLTDLAEDVDFRKPPRLVEIR